MRLLWLLLLAPALSGCITDPAPGADLAGLEVYRFVYPGAEKAVSGAEHGWLLRVANPGNDTAVFHVGATGVQAARLGPATATGWDTTPSPPADAPDAVWGGRVVVPARQSVALLVSVERYGPGETGLLFVRDDGQTRRVPVPVSTDEAGPAVQPGDHVRTLTVGVWVNGTSFYTNSASLLQDPGFPAGGNVDRLEALRETDPLPVYVYDRDRTEQPDGSMDTCHFTTITGYNALLRTQVTGSTGVRWMSPEEAYTAPGREDHLLYGDALVFLNTVVAHDGATGPLDGAPNPQGACFDQERYVPPVDASDQHFFI